MRKLINNFNKMEKKHILSKDCWCNPEVVSFRKSVHGVLARDIKAGTPVIDLYGDGNFYYLIDGTYYPVDFNGMNHGDFIKK